MKTVTTWLGAVLIAFSAACSQTDSGVTSKVKAKFAQDDLVKAHEIDVTTRDGVVTLTGEVDTTQARQRAVRLASETEGVSNVVDELEVEVAATSGDRDDIDVDVDGDVDVDVDNDLERGARATGRAIEKGAEATGNAVRKAGEAARDAVTDDDPDSDRDGK